MVFFGFHVCVGEGSLSNCAELLDSKAFVYHGVGVDVNGRRCICGGRSGRRVVSVCPHACA